MNTLGKIEHTPRGFERIEFSDRSGYRCSMQQSSAFDCHNETPGVSAIWLGSGENRMHLNHEQVTALVAHLSAWVETGSFVVADDNGPQAA